MELNDFFQALEAENIDFNVQEFPDSFGAKIVKYVMGGEFPDLTDVKIAIFGVEEDRAAVNNSGSAYAPDLIRSKLFKLKFGNHNTKVVDLGNIRAGHELNDTYFAVNRVCASLLKKNIIPVIIGGSQDLTYSQYLAYQDLEQTVNIVAVDSRFDIGDTDLPLDSQSYLGKIIMHQPNHLFNFSNVGYQTYFVGQDSIDLMDKLYFDAYRLGEVRADMEEVEPIVRNADILTFDISSIRQSDAPANLNTSPHGFYGEEACQIVRYAGLSDKLSSIGFYETNPKMDRDGQTIHLVAHLIWFFIEGVAARKNDQISLAKSEFLKFSVPIEEHEQDLVFYKNPKSERWWIEVPYLASKSKYSRHHLIPCSYKDYKVALEGRIPDRWWQALHKLN